jgi:hypothetical protein
MTPFFWVDYVDSRYLKRTKVYGEVKQQDEGKAAEYSKHHSSALLGMDSAIALRDFYNKDVDTSLFHASDCSSPPPKHTHTVAANALQ